MRAVPRPLAALFAVVALVVALAPAAHAEVRWRTWDDGLAAAKKSRRRVIVDVYTNWCGWCRRMDADVYGRADIAAYLAEHFVTVKLNAESNDTAHRDDRPMTARSLAASYRVNSYPTTIFLDSSGGHLATLPGYVPPEKFLLLLRWMGDGAMDAGVKWEDWVKSQEGAK